MRRHAIFTALLAQLPLAMLRAAEPPRLCLEAESATALEAPCVRVCATNLPAGSKWIAGASAAAYLEIPEGSGNPPKLEAGFAAFSVTVPAPGAYTLWARVYWEGECSNSFQVQLDETAPFLFGEDGTYKTWHWVKYPVARLGPQLQLTQGLHRLTFRNREDGVRLDQVVLSADRRWVPVDIEPVTAGATP